MSYQVKIDKFQGPLDVLLQLIEDQKLTIAEISLAQVTQQFLDHIKSLSDVHPDILADFLTIASKLIVIKSRSLLPSLEAEIEEDEAVDLTNQLLQFKKFKEIAKYIRSLEDRGKRSFNRDVALDEQIAFYPDPGITVTRLNRAMQALSQSLQEIVSLPKQVVKEIISISEKIKELQRSLTQRLEMKLSEALQKKSRTEIIVTFLALLELTKQRILSVEQEALFADITIKKRSHPELAVEEGV